MVELQDHWIRFPAADTRVIHEKLRDENASLLAHQRIQSAIASSVGVLVGVVVLLRELAAACSAAGVALARLSVFESKILKRMVAPTSSTQAAANLSRHITL
jgi:hypothetical protein